MRRLDAFVTEPQRNDGDVHPCLQQVHGRGMSNQVRGDALVSQARTRHNRTPYTFLQEIVDAIATQRLSASVGEGHGRIAWVRFQLLEPRPQYSGRRGPQRDGSFFPSLAGELDEAFD